MLLPSFSLTCPPSHLHICKNNAKLLFILCDRRHMQSTNWQKRVRTVYQLSLENTSYSCTHYLTFIRLTSESAILPNLLFEEQCNSQMAMIAATSSSYSVLTEKERNEATLNPQKRSGESSAAVHQIQTSPPLLLTANHQCIAGGCSQPFQNCQFVCPFCGVYKICYQSHLHILCLMLGIDRFWWSQLSFTFLIVLHKETTF